MSRILVVIVAVWLLVPSWTGEERVPAWSASPRVTVSRVALQPGTARRRVGALDFLDGFRLSSRDPAFGGYSALSVDGRRVTLLSDTSLILRFALDAAGDPRDFGFAGLPTGPRIGWRREDRDSESWTRDPATGRDWVGFENANQVWRFGDGLTRAEGHAAPAAMAGWPDNAGPEAIVRLRSGRFLVIAEQKRAPGGGRVGLIFDRDPVAGAKLRAFAYLPPAGHVPVDIAELPDGRLMILNRRFSWRGGFTTVLTVVEGRAIRPGARVAGRVIATLAPPLLHDNFEGLAVTRDATDTIVWLVSDDNQSWFQETLLLKFRLVPPGRPRPAG